MQIESDWTLRYGDKSLISNITCTKQSSRSFWTTWLSQPTHCETSSWSDVLATTYKKLRICGLY